MKSIVAILFVAVLAASFAAPPLSPIPRPPADTDARARPLPFVNEAAPKDSESLKGAESAYYPYVYSYPAVYPYYHYPVAYWG